MVKFLVENGSFVNATSRTDGKTALIIAIDTGNFDIVKYLVEFGGADVNQADDDGQMPRSYADLRGFTEISEYLTQHRATYYSYYPTYSNPWMFGPG